MHMHMQTRQGRHSHAHRNTPEKAHTNSLTGLLTRTYLKDLVMNMDRNSLPCTGFGSIMYTSVNAIYIIPCWVSHREEGLEENAGCYSFIVVLMDY